MSHDVAIYALGINTIHLAGRLGSTGLDISRRGNQALLKYNDAN